LWRIQNFAALSPCGSQSAEFVKYDSLVGLGISQPLEIFQFRCPTDAGAKDGNRMGDEGKAVGSAQAPAALLSPIALAAMREKGSADLAMSVLGQKATSAPN
jgi:hypothetical protein